MEILNKESKNILIGFIGVLSILILTLAVSIASGIPAKIKNEVPGAKNTITVVGNGEVFAKPDLALANFSVVTEAKTVTDALSENTKKMNAVIDFIKKQGVEEKDLKTTNFSIFPRYEFVSESRPDLIYPSPLGKRVLAGYEVQQSLEVKIRDMSKIGSIIEGASAAGANQLGNLQFTIDNEDNLKKEARQKAIEKAKDRAKELAGQLGIRLGKITDFTESGGGMPIFFMAEKSLGIGGGDEVPSPTIEPGENKIEVQVTVTYEIH